MIADILIIVVGVWLAYVVVNVIEKNANKSLLDLKRSELKKILWNVCISVEAGKKWNPG